jgi:hypothetical protein
MRLLKGSALWMQRYVVELKFEECMRLADR